MIQRHKTPLVRVAPLCAFVLLGGCATPPAPPAVDPVDTFIAEQMANSASAVRDLASTTRGTRKDAGQPTAELDDDEGERGAAAKTPAEAAAVTAIALRDLAATRNNTRVVDAQTGEAVSPAKAKELLAKTPAGLETKFTGRYVGELEPLMERLAKAAGWRVLRSEGVRVAPVTVAINATDRSVYQVLRDLGAMVGDSVDIVVSVPDKTFRLRYPNR
ncbi:MAG: DotD/TraH family lipoprotein [Polaromonas sp.]|nr:DotD/TraH family lipoprotein [Polaromonas sp.]